MKNSAIVCLLLASSAAGEVLTRTAETTVPAAYTVELPEGFDSTRTYPLIVAIHGFGDRMEAYVGTAARLCPEGAVGLYPESPYPMPSKEEGPLGFTWEVWTDSAHWLQGKATAEASVRWILDAIRLVQADYRIDPAGVFLFGFSQGGYLTYEIGLRRPELFAGLLPAGGWLPWDSAATLDRAVLATPTRILHGVDDDVCDFAGAEQAYDTLKARGVPVELMRYPARHQLTRELFEDARDFVWCVLHERERQPLANILYPELQLPPEDRARQLQQVLCATDSRDEIADGLVSIYAAEAEAAREKIVYLLGAVRCVKAEAFLRDILQGESSEPHSRALRQAAYSALVKLGTESAWEVVDQTEMEVAVRDVVPGSQAEAVGLRPGDAILSYAGRPITSPDDIRAAKGDIAEDAEQVLMVVRRGDEVIELTLTPGSIGIWTEARPK